MEESKGLWMISFLKDSVGTHMVGVLESSNVRYGERRHFAVDSSNPPRHAAAAGRIGFDVGDGMNRLEKIIKRILGMLPREQQ